MDQNEPLQKELTYLREKIRSTLERLADAETALLFYSNPKNYKEVPWAFTLRIVTELQQDSEETDNSHKVLVGGRRARQYFEKYRE